TFTVTRTVEFRQEMLDFKKRKEQLEHAQAQGNYSELKRLELINIELFPQQVIYYVDLSICLMHLNEVDLAWQVLSQAWQIARNSYRVLIGMSNYFLKVGNFAMAEKTCKILMDMAPNELMVLAMLTESLLGQNRYEEAVKIGVPLIEVASMVGELPEGMNYYLIRRMADYLEQKKDYNTILHLWETYIKNKQNDIEARLELVKVLTRQGNLARVLQLITEIRNISPKNNELETIIREYNIPTGKKRPD
ncbi:MAG: hypothetical protein LWX83_13590, partial [Anaerolineae bacterium]|nr:hypothetical protein [Anaerolineae bacterium]